jgi:hypothetical protein
MRPLLWFAAWWRRLILFILLQEGLVPFEIGVPVAGDVAIGVWFGSYNLGARLHGRPALAYAFHTAFLDDSGVERVEAAQLDVAQPDLFPPDAQRSFFMDVKLGPAEAQLHSDALDGEAGVEGGDVQVPLYPPSMGPVDGPG